MSNRKKNKNNKKPTGIGLIQEEMPELLNIENAERLYQYLEKEYGYSADVLDRCLEAELFIIAEKARRYDEIKEICGGK